MAFKKQNYYYVLGQKGQIPTAENHKELSSWIILFLYFPKAIMTGEW